MVSKKLKINKHETVGRLCEFWLFVSKYAKDGDITDKVDYIEELCGWTGDCGVFLDALLEAKFIIEEGDKFKVKDWFDHTGKFLEEAERHRERMRIRRIKDKEKLLYEAKEASCEGNIASTNTSSLPHSASTVLAQISHSASTVREQFSNSSRTVQEQCYNSEKTVLAMLPGTNQPTNQPTNLPCNTNTCPTNSEKQGYNCNNGLNDNNKTSFQTENEEEIQDGKPFDTSLTDNVFEDKDSIPVSVQNTISEEDLAMLGVVPENVIQIDKKKSKKDSSAIEEEFNFLWEKWIRKEGKTSALASYRKHRKNYSFEQIESAEGNYINHAIKNNIEYKFLKMGSTFFNGGFVDYVDGSPEEKYKQENKEVEVYGKRDSELTRFVTDESRFSFLNP